MARSWFPIVYLRNVSHAQQGQSITRCLCQVLNGLDARAYHTGAQTHFNFKAYERFV